MRYFPINKSTNHITSYKTRKTGYGLLSKSIGSNIKEEVYTSPVIKPTQVLRDIKVAKSRLPKKYITFE